MHSVTVHKLQEVQTSICMIPYKKNISMLQSSGFWDCTGRFLWLFYGKLLWRHDTCKARAVTPASVATTQNGQPRAGCRVPCSCLLQMRVRERRAPKSFGRGRSRENPALGEVLLHELGRALGGAGAEELVGAFPMEHIERDSHL